ncbi:endo-1,3;1,4-beta-D-glucanase-like [Durio zibethinus]|uniref:Endo-1,31,4-beta-D-glucanase-like n=1 Tax=Durio zibethinus TaxID=66656 RepID=A0A6P6AAR8_DURZI|nr:endo-1,3;1,4-beta-D-glucanase-like [Durio zibethinus]
MSGPQCCSNPPTLNPASGVGHVENLAGFKTYVTGSLHSKIAVLLVSDVYGYEAPNLRKLADKVAAVGFYVVIPDFLYGEPFVPERSDRPLAVWIKDHRPEKGFEDAKLIIEALKSKGVSAIGAAGFCWGAKVVVELAKDALIQAAVMLHPSFVTVEDIKSVKLPIAILGAEIDQMSPPELVKQFDEILSANEVDSYVRIFPKCVHGWTVRYKVDDPTAVRCADEAHQDMLQWFTKYVK